MHPPELSEGVQYATGEEQRRTANSPRKNEVAGPKRKWWSVVDVSGDESKMWCCKEQYCIGTWNVRSLNQGKLDAVIRSIRTFSWKSLGQKRDQTSQSSGKSTLNTLERTDAELKLQSSQSSSSRILVSWCKQTTHWESPWCSERSKAEGEEGIRGWDGWMASPMQWTWT